MYHWIINTQNIKQTKENEETQVTFEKRWQKIIIKKNNIYFTESVCAQSLFLIIIRLFYSISQTSFVLKVWLEIVLSEKHKFQLRIMISELIWRLNDVLALNLDEYSASRVCVRDRQRKHCETNPIKLTDVIME